MPTYLWSSLPVPYRDSRAAGFCGTAEDSWFVRTLMWKRRHCGMFLPLVLGAASGGPMGHTTQMTVRTNITQPARSIPGAEPSRIFTMRVPHSSVPSVCPAKQMNP